MGKALVLTETISEYDSLLAEVQKLKDEIAELTAEKDDLELHICRGIQAEYDHKIGGLEYQITAYNLEIEKLRSTIEYMQAAINKGQQATRQEAEESAEEELHSFYEDLDRKAKKIKREQEYARQRQEQDKENAKKSGYEPEDEPEDEAEEEGEPWQDSARKNINPAVELKSLYHKIVKALHPDMNPDITEREKALLDDAIKAYSAGDLERLREIAEMIDDADISARFQNTEEGIEELKALRDQLLSRRQSLADDIERIKNSFPYNMIDFLADDEAVEARQRELMSIIESCRNTISVLNERIALLQKQMEH